MNNTAPGAPQLLPDKYEAPRFLYAGMGRRAAAFVQDCLCVFMITVALVFLLKLVAIRSGSAGALQELDDAGAGKTMFVLVAWLYSALCESSRWQATLGKWSQDIGVTDLYGRRIGFGRASARVFGMWLSALPVFIGFLMAAWTPRKQAFHDWMADCCVVNRRELVTFKRGQLNAAHAVSGTSTVDAAAPSR